MNLFELGDTVTLNLLYYTDKDVRKYWEGTVCRVASTNELFCKTQHIVEDKDHTAYFSPKKILPYN